MEQPASSSGTTLTGMLLDERYRLEQVRSSHRLADGRTVTLWRALDVALERRVAVVVAATRTKKARKALTDAANRASHVSDGRCVRVLDVGDLDVDGEPCGWIASEWVEGPSLAALLRREPLRPAAAVAVVTQCAEAIAAAHRVGCHHGRLHPDEVLLAPGGLPRITGIETAAVLAGGDADSGTADDVRGLGALLFAAMTAQWPLPGWTGLPRPVHGDREHPRAVHAGIGRDVDDVTARALSGGYPDVETLLQALHRLPAEPLDAPPPAVRRNSDVVARWAWRLVPPLLVAVIALGGWVVGSDLGKVPQSARMHHEALPAATATAPGAGPLTTVWRTPPQVTSFDPEGDGQENPDAVGFAVDHDPSTTWTTDLYRTAHLGGLKAGVGLLIDLRHPTTVRVAELALLGVGSDVELRAGDRAPRQPGDLRLVAQQAPAGSSVTWTLSPQVTARYWLIWFTNLPKAKGGYRGGITDVALLGPSAG